MTPSPPVVPLRVKAWHGLGSVTYGVKEAGLTTFFMIYYNQVLGFDPRVVSLVLIGAMLVDAIADPAIGRLSDATRSRFGRRLPWLYLSALPMAIAWTLLWLPASMVPHNGWTLLLNVVAVRVLVSACEIPSIALVAELTRDYDDRTTLMRYRFLFGWVGGLITTALAYGYFLKSRDGSGNGLLDPEGYAGFGLFGAAMIIASTTLSALGQHRTIMAMPPPAVALRSHGGNMFTDIVTALRHPAFLALATGAFFLFTGYAVAIGAVNYTALYVWRFTDAQLANFPIALVIAVLGAFAATGLAHRRLGKRDTAMLFMMISGALWFVPYLGRNIGLWPALGGTASMLLLFIFMTTALFCHIIANISVASMVAEVVEAHEAEAGTRNEGVFFAGYLMVNKFGNAAGIFIVGQIVALAGLGGKVSPDALPPGTATIMAWTMAGVLTGLAFASAWGLRNYPITRDNHDARIAALAVAEGCEKAGGD
jgi:glycoside/pentoside/hexuronide:cation symporter, GPH family